MLHQLPSAAVALSNVGRSFDGRRVLSNIDLRVERGEFVVLVGKSGCGKSTLLRIVGGLDAGAAGDIHVTPNLAVCFQDARLLPWKLVWENVILGLAGNPSELRARANGALEEVRLTARAEAWPLTLSGGEAQRVALARALVRTPDLLLMDEPFAALDALTRLKMQQLVLRLRHHHAIATLFVTHDVEEALLLADRILLIDNGRLELDLFIDLPRPRRRDEPRFVDLRSQLLSALGVLDEDAQAEAEVNLRD